MDLASVVAALASVGVRVSGSTPNNNIQGDSSRACPTGLAGPEPSGTLNDPGQHFQGLRPFSYRPLGGALGSLNKGDTVCTARGLHPIKALCVYREGKPLTTI